MKQPTLHILCAIHKPSPIPPLDFIVPVHVGAVNATWQSPFLKDNEGDNISGKNSYYNEITALYWAWKNKAFSGSDYIGLCHYRRFFMAHRPFLSKKGVYKFNLNSNDYLPKISGMPKAAAQLLAKHDLVISKPSWARDRNDHKISIEEQFGVWHHGEDWQLLRESIAVHQPAYKASFEVYSKMQKFNQLNMYIGKRNFLDQYLPWVMSILEPLEIKVAQRTDPYQKRAIGFLGERLLGLYILHQQLSTAWLPVAFLEE